MAEAQRRPPARSAGRWIGADRHPDARDPAWSPAGFLTGAVSGPAVPGQSPGSAAPRAALLGSGREALAYLLTAAGVRGRRVLLPAFGCAALAQAVRLAGAEPAFHPGDDRLRPDWDAIRRAVADPRIAAIVLVHPFGWLQEPPHGGPSPLPPGVALVEDASHTVCNARGARFHGPAVSAGLAASLRKGLPLAAGLAARWDGEDLPGVGGPPTPAAVSFAAAHCAAWTEGGAGRRHAWLQRAEGHLDGADRGTTPGAPFGPPPHGARRALAALAARPRPGLAAWRARCRGNWRALADALRGSRRVRPFHHALAEGVCPLGFVIRHPDRTALARRLLARGVAATLHWPVPSEARPFLTRDERMLAGTILTLPCGGDHGPEDMEWVARSVLEEERLCGGG